MTTTADIDVAAILSAILVIGCGTKPVFELEQEVGGKQSIYEIWKKSD